MSSIICLKVSSYQNGKADSPEFTEKWMNRAVKAILVSSLLAGAQTYAGMRVSYDEKTSIIVATIVTVCVAAIFTNKVAIDMSDNYRGGSCGGVPLPFLTLGAVAVWGTFATGIAVMGQANLDKPSKYAGLGLLAGFGTVIIHAGAYAHIWQRPTEKQLGIGSSQAKPPLLTLEDAQEV